MKSAYHQAYYKLNKEKILAQQKEYRKLNKGKIQQKLRKRGREYYQKNRADILAKIRLKKYEKKIIKFQEAGQLSLFAMEAN